jgi:hypothetical protein
MAIIGDYSRRDSMLDRAQFGVKNGLVAGAVTGLGAAGALQLWKPSMPIKQKVAIGGAVGAAALTGVVSGHLANGSDDSRFMTAVGASALTGAGTGALYSRFGAAAMTPVRIGAYAGAGLAIGTGIGVLGSVLLED